MYALTSKKWRELHEAEEAEKKFKKQSRKGVEKGKGKKGNEKGKGKKGDEKGKGKKGVEKGKGKKGEEKGKGKKRAEKQGMIDQTDEDDSGGDWKCMVCDFSFFQQEEDGVECKWVRSVTKHHMSLASQKCTEYISLLIVKMKRNTFVQTGCTNLAEDSDNYI